MIDVCLCVYLGTQHLVLFGLERRCGMPIYEYGCDACGHEFEALQKISDDALTDCPECGGKTLRKKVSAAAFRLKGSGWYETDFKSGKKKNLASSETKSDSASGKPEGAGKATKKETKASKP